MSVAERPGIKLPGLREQRLFRRWTTEALEQRSGIQRDTIERAERGDAVSATTADMIISALEAAPISETARAVLGIDKPESDRQTNKQAVERLIAILGIVDKYKDEFSKNTPNAKRVIQGEVQRTVHGELGVVELLDTLSRERK